MRKNSNPITHKSTNPAGDLFRVTIKQGLFESDETYTFDFNCSSIFKLVERTFKFYFRCTIVKLCRVQNGVEIEIPECAGVTWQSKLSLMDQIILNDKNIRLKKAKDLKFKK